MAKVNGVPGFTNFKKVNILDTFLIRGVPINIGGGDVTLVNGAALVGTLDNDTQVDVATVNADNDVVIGNLTVPTILQGFGNIVSIETDTDGAEPLGGIQWIGSADEQVATIGYFSGESGTFVIESNEANGNIDLRTNGTGDVLINGSPISGGGGLTNPLAFNEALLGDDVGGTARNLIVSNAPGVVAGDSNLNFTINSNTTTTINGTTLSVNSATVDFNGANVTEASSYRIEQSGTGFGPNISKAIVGTGVNFGSLSGAQPYYFEFNTSSTRFLIVEYNASFTEVQTGAGFTCGRITHTQDQIGLSADAAVNIEATTTSGNINIDGGSASGDVSITGGGDLTVQGNQGETRPIGYNTVVNYDVSASTTFTSNRPGDSVTFTGSTAAQTLTFNIGASGHPAGSVITIYNASSVTVDYAVSGTAPAMDLYDGSSITSGTTRTLAVGGIATIHVIATNLARTYGSGIS